MISLKSDVIYVQDIPGTCLAKKNFFIALFMILTSKPLFFVTRRTILACASLRKIPFISICSLAARTIVCIGKIETSLEYETEQFMLCSNYLQGKTENGKTETDKGKILKK